MKNMNAGYGKFTQAAPFLGGGQVHVVGSATGNKQILQEIFKVDDLGEVRFHATLASVVSHLTANRGDTVYVCPGHTETVDAAGDIDFSVAGVRYVGLGEGDNKPKITFDTVNTADIDISASNQSFENLIFINDVDGLAEPLDIAASVENITFKGCEFRDDTAAKQTVRWVQTAATNNRIRFIDCVNYGSDTSGSTAWVTLTGGAHHVFENCVSHGDFSAANIEIKTTLTADLLIDGCTLENANAVDVNVEGNSLSNTGWIKNTMCRLATDGQTTWVNNIGGITIYESYGADNSGESGSRIGTASSGSIEDDVAEILTDTGTTLPATLATIDGYHDVPSADSADNSQARDVIGNKTDTTGGDSLVALIKQILEDTGTTVPAVLGTPAGADLATDIADLTTDVENTETAPGTVFTVQKTLTSSTIVQAGIDLTGMVTGGHLLLMDIELACDGTGLAGGTNVIVLNDNDYGENEIMEEAVANLGANKSVNLINASVGNVEGTRLEGGKKLAIKSTVADCTGAGEVVVTMTFRRITDGASVSAA